MTEETQEILIKYGHAFREVIEDNYSNKELVDKVIAIRKEIDLELKINEKLKEHYRSMYNVLKALVLEDE